MSTDEGLVRHQRTARRPPRNPRALLGPSFTPGGPYTAGRGFERVAVGRYPPSLRRYSSCAWPNERPTSSALWWSSCLRCLRGRPVARRVLYAALPAALCVPCGVPAAARFARCAVPDGVLCRTSARPLGASQARRLARWFGPQPLRPRKLRTKPQAQTSLRIQGRLVRCDDIPVSAPNGHSLSGSRLLPRRSNLSAVVGLLIDLDQLGRVVQAILGFRSTGSTLWAGVG